MRACVCVIALAVLRVEGHYCVVNGKRVLNVASQNFLNTSMNEKVLVSPAAADWACPAEHRVVQGQWFNCRLPPARTTATVVQPPKPIP